MNEIQKTTDSRHRDLISDWKTGEALGEQVSPKLSLGSLQNYNMNNRVKDTVEGFPGGAVVRNPPANAGDTGSSPGLGRSHMPRSG